MIGESLLRLPHLDLFYRSFTVPLVPISGEA